MITTVIRAPMMKKLVSPLIQLINTTIFMNSPIQIWFPIFTVHNRHHQLSSKNVAISFDKLISSQNRTEIGFGCNLFQLSGDNVKKKIKFRIKCYLFQVLEMNIVPLRATNHTKPRAKNNIIKILSIENKMIWEDAPHPHRASATFKMPSGKAHTNR